MTRFQKTAALFGCLALSVTLFFAFGGGFGTFSNAYHSLTNQSTASTAAGCDGGDVGACLADAAKYQPLGEAGAGSDYWDQRVTYPTGNYNNLWLRHAAAQAKKVKNAVPAGKVAKFTKIPMTTVRKVGAAPRYAPITSNFVPLGPAPERMTGCSGCFDYGTTAGRVNDIVIDQTTTTNGTIVAYAASDGGGVWKTTNCCATATTTWAPVTDDPLISNISIDTLTIDPNNHNTIYAGTGDLNYGSFSMGSQGILKSTDAGAHWTVLGSTVFGPALNTLPTVAAGNFPQYDAVGKVRVDPNNSNIVAAGTKTGVWLSYDGGTNWTGPCSTNSFPTQRQDITGLELSDMGLGQTRIFAAVGVRGFASPVQNNLNLNGANGLYKATMPASGCPSFTSIASDANGFVFGTAVTGSPYATGAPMRAGSGTAICNANNLGVCSPAAAASTGDQLGRIDIAVAPSNPNVMYAQVGSILPNSGTNCGNAAGCQLGAWASTDGGTTWSFMAGSAGGSLRGCNSSGGSNSTTNYDYPQNWYDQGVEVDPNNPDRVFFQTFEVWMATRTGTTWYNTSCAYTQTALGVHADEHAMAFVNGSSAILLIGNDGGVMGTLNANAAVLNTTRPTWFNLDGVVSAGVPAGSSFNTIEFYMGDIWGGNATDPFFGPYTSGNTPWAVGGAQDNMVMTTHFAGTPTGPVQWQGNVGGDGFWTAIDGKGGYFYVTNNSGQLHRCTNATNNCANTGAVYGSNIASTITSADAARQSFVSPFDLFRGNPGGTGNAECGTRCNHMIYGTYRVWESTAIDTASFGSVANAVRTGDLTKNTLGGRSYINNLHYAQQNQTLAIAATNDGNIQVLYGLGGGNGVAAPNVNLTDGNAVLPNRPMLDARLDPNTQNTLANPFIGYAAVGGFSANTPSTPGHVYRFTCTAVNCAGGATWQDKSGIPGAGGLPDIPVDSIIVNPNVPNQVFAGTDFGLYFTNDITATNPTWYHFQNGLPSTMIWTMTVDRAKSALSLWTRSRGAYAWPLPVSAIKQAQSISFGSLADKTYGDADFLVSATSDSGLDPTFIASGSCTVTGSMVHITSGGSCTITAQQAGNIDYNAAADVPQSFNIAKTTQSISFPPIADKTTADQNFPAGASASSGLDISYTGNANCSVNGAGLVHLIHIGTCTITASQPGNGAYFAATDEQQSFTVTRGAQTIDFNLIDKTYGDADFLISAPSTSGLTVTLTKVSGPCSLDSATSPSHVNISGTGSCTITASQAGDDDYFPATDETRSFSIAKAAQTITFAALSNKTWGDPDFDVSASGGGSGNAVTFVAQDDCTISGTTVHITGAGSCTITASQTGDDNYNPASDVQRTFTILKANQTISFAALDDKTYLDPDFDISATSSSGGTVAFAASGNCALVSGKVHITGAGSCTITASQDGSSNYNAAPDVPRTFSIAKADQTVDFAALDDKTYGDPDFDVSATSTSGGTVTFTVSGDCALVFGKVSITAAGSCTVTAHQTGSANYNAAPDVPQSFLIAKANQSITFGAVGDSTFGDADFEIAPTASSGLTVALDASGPCSLSSAVSPANVHITGAGTCTITASQDGNGNYNDATDVQRQFSISKASQTITFATPSDRTYGDPDFDPAATASSGDDVSYTASGDCSIVSDMVHITGAGSCTVTAHQTGNGNYNPAPDEQRSFTINKAAQAISIGTSAPSSAVYGTGFTVAATGGATGNAIVYSSAGSCSNSGAHFTMTAGTGACTVKYNQAGNANYNAAPQQSETVNANKAALSITANNRHKYYGQIFPLGNTAFSSTGLVGSDSVTVTLASAGSAAGAATGTYAISASNAAAGPNTSVSDYAITYHGATLTVSQVGIIGLNSVSVDTGKIDSFDSGLGKYGSSNSGHAAIVMSNSGMTFGGSLLGSAISTAGSVSVSSGQSVSGDVTAGTVAFIDGSVGGTVTDHSPSDLLSLGSVAKCSPFSSKTGIKGVPAVFTYANGNLTVKSGIVSLANGTYCFHNVIIKGGAVLKVSGPVTIHLTGKLRSVGSGGTISNTTGLPSNLHIDSSFKGPDGVSLRGSFATAMTLRAPWTDVSISKGAFFGTVYASFVTLSNKVAFHADMH